MRFISLLGALCTIYFVHIQIRPPHRTSYQELINRPRHTRKHCLAQHPIVQIRQNHRKEFWIPQKDERLRFSLTSDCSRLLLQEQEELTHLLEQLQQVHCTDGTRDLSAQNGFYSYRSKQIDLDGDVRLSSQECFLYAPHCTYFLDSRKALLESDRETSRVLFWDKANARSLSARKLVIDLDLTNPFEEIKAYGDVHCTFDLEERALIQRLFEHF